LTVPEFLCRDCKVNTVPLEGDREYYEVTDGIWHAAGGYGFGQSDNGVGGFYLCIGCLEKRLGRPLVRSDFKDYPANSPSPWLSDRLNAILKGGPLFFPNGSKDETPQFFPNALMSSVIERYNPRTRNMSLTGSVSLGINQN
jgi:hypothetical protein